MYSYELNPPKQKGVSLEGLGGLQNSFNERNIFLGPRGPGFGPRVNAGSQINFRTTFPSAFPGSLF